MTWEKGNFAHYSWQYSQKHILEQSLQKAVGRPTKKILKVWLECDLPITLWIFLNEMDQCRKHLISHVYCSTIHHTIHHGINLCVHHYIHIRILCSYKKQHHITCDNMDKLGRHSVKWNKPDAERQILHNFILCEIYNKVDSIEIRYKTMVSRG